MRMLPVKTSIEKRISSLTQRPESLIRLAFRARKKLGLRGVSELRRAVGRVSRQLIYRTLTKPEIDELNHWHARDMLKNIAGETPCKL
jgi:hypothetical protein